MLFSLLLLLLLLLNVVSGEKTRGMEDGRGTFMPPERPNFVKRFTPRREDSLPPATAERYLTIS